MPAKRIVAALIGSLVLCVFAGFCLAQSIGGGAYPDLGSYAKKTDVPALTAPLKSTPICTNPTIPGGNTLSNSTASEQTFASTCVLTLSPGDFAVCDLSGMFTIPVLNIPSLTGRVKANGAQILTTASIPGLIQGSFGWGARFTLWVPAAGGSLDAQGRLYAFTGGNSEVPAGMWNPDVYPLAAGPASITLTFHGQWSNSSGGSSITLRQVGCK